MICVPLSVRSRVCCRNMSEFADKVLPRLPGVLQSGVYKELLS